LVVRLEAASGWGEVETIEIGRLERRVVGLTAEEVGLALAEGKNLLGELPRLILEPQIEEFITWACVCRECGGLCRRDRERANGQEATHEVVSTGAHRVATTRAVVPDGRLKPATGLPLAATDQNFNLSLQEAMPVRASAILRPNGIVTTVVGTPPTGTILATEITGSISLGLPMLVARFRPMVVTNLLGIRRIYDLLRELAERRMHPSILRPSPSEREAIFGAINQHSGLACVPPPRPT
jgi:hypothetical protein